ncbi:MAG: ImmA/IrrE family metallo-endopeptidase [Eubacterium sp.]|jgi:Zn-dependent peptidase ImmA (M78 family)|nr:ImmA/IrrE family metallo-endopeptidase [Eubacterium sp.]
MEFERFKKIIEYNQKNQVEITRKVRDLYSKADVDYERDLLNVMQVVRPLFEKKRYIVVEIPFKDKEIGAICYKGDSLGYTFLNSSLPKVNVNFALCHEIYHIFYQEQSFKQKIELYMNEHYFEYEEELSANSFAGVLLMPEQSFENMFRKFQSEKTDEDTEVSLIVKLMSYFEVPYMAALIRCYELNLLNAGEKLEKLLIVNSEVIENEFVRLWLNEDLLKPTNKDDYKKLESFVKKIGDDYLKEEILNHRTVSKVLENMKKIYEEIRG